MRNPSASHGRRRAGSRSARTRRRSGRSGRTLRVRVWNSLRRAPVPVQTVLACCGVILFWLLVNWTYQVVRKPSELFFPVSGTLYKTPAETWAEYAPLFKRHATTVMTPALLAAIAQVEGSGNPVARTYWRFAWSRQPFEIYRPASSSVGMYQMTDGTFAEARHFCIRDHHVATEGAWNDWKSCWFNSLYARVVPGDAVELASAYLDHSVASILERHGMGSLPLSRKQELASLIHLCGAGAGDDYARRGLRLVPGQNCGSEDPRRYIARVESMKQYFERLATADSPPT